MESSTEYYKKYREQNREKLREYCRSYYDNNREEMLILVVNWGKLRE